MLQCLGGLLLTIFLAFCGVAFKWNLSTASLLYLLLVVSFAIYCGFWQASLISVGAIACETYFFAPPAFSFYIADPRNGIAIVVFELTALLVSSLAAREKKLAAESAAQQERLQRLFEVSRGALLLDLNDSPERKLAELIYRAFRFDAVAILDTASGARGVAGSWPPHGGATAASDCTESPSDLGYAETTLPSASTTTGRLQVCGAIQPLTLEALASLVALTLERHRAFLQKGDAESARRSEELRSTVLDGLAHAFKTPLTIIRAASSGLLEYGNLNALQGELTQTIDEQSMRLDDLATRLLSTARLSGDEVSLQLETVEVRTLLEEVAVSFSEQAAARLAPARTRIEVQLPAYGLYALADHDMLRSTLMELMGNAMKYSAPDRAVTISAGHIGDELLFTVHSWSPVIPIEDRERIFDRFYRGLTSQAAAPGAGIGLSIARRATEAHQGTIWVTSNQAEGTTFHIALPRQLRRR